jgi:hypothetical protein
MFAWITNLFSGTARKAQEKVVEDLQTSLAALKQTEEQLVEEIQRVDAQLNKTEIGSLGPLKMKREQMVFQLQENRAVQKQLQAQLQEAQTELRKLT